MHQRDAREPGGGEPGKLAKRLRSLFLIRPEQSRLNGHENPKQLGAVGGPKVGVRVRVEECEGGGRAGKGKCQRAEIFDAHRDVWGCRLPLLHIDF